MLSRGYLKYWWWCVVLPLGLVCIVWSSRVAAAESIESFLAEYEVRADGSVRVQETITYDFAGNERRGIERILDDRHAQSASAWYKTRYVTISDITARMVDDPDLSYELRGPKGHTVRIAYPDPTVTGTHSYEVEYTLEGVLSYDEQDAELYWNVTGDEWRVPIRHAVIEVIAETPELLSKDAACYQGRAGETDACDSVERATSSVVFRATDLAPGEHLTVAVALHRSVVDEQINEHVSWLFFGLLAAAAWVLYLSWWVYRVRTKDKLSAPRVTQYEPYAEYPPMYTGVLYNSRLDHRDITAGLIYLAQQGFLYIKREETTSLWVFTNVDYTLTLRQPIAEAPSQFLRRVLELVFTSSAIVNDSVKLSSLQRSGRAQVNQRVITSLRTALRSDLRDNGYLIKGSPIPFSRAIVVVSLLLLVFGSFAFLVPDGLIVLVLVLVESATLFGIAYIDRYTKKGRVAQHHLEGFKHFLAMTETRRYEFHNAPERNPETFLQYLPYAIAFGVEKQWAQAFADISIQPPEWYQSASVGGVFPVTEFTSNISSFSESFSQASGSTGSSGGGSAGGGGGGGGGGSV